MRATLPITIDSTAKLLSSTAAETHAPTAYNAYSNYSYGSIVAVYPEFRIYESLLNNNNNNNPASSPVWWKLVGYTEQPWSSVETYAEGATVSFNNRIYESLQAANLNNPVPNLPDTQTSWWLDVGATNKWSMFDLSSNTKTIVQSPLVVTIKPGQRINTVGILGMSANTVTISASSLFGGGVVYGPVTEDLNIRTVTDAYEYAFESFNTQPSVAWFDIPPYSDIEITITISSTSGNVKCGAVVVGTFAYLGQVQYGANGGAINFSTIERDIYGNATLIPRRSVPKTNQTLWLDSSLVNKARAARTALNAVPALWTGLDDGDNAWFDMLMILGIYKTFDIDASSPTHATINLEIEEI